MRATVYLCGPQGSTSEQFARLTELVKDDNRKVIAAMLREGMEVPDTVGQMGLRYHPLPPQHEGGEPVVFFRGYAKMLKDGVYSCGCAAAWEAAVAQEKYGVPSRTLAAPQRGATDHVVYTNALGTFDPVARHRNGLRSPYAGMPVRGGTACELRSGVVTCEEAPACAVDSRTKRWVCPDLPEVNGRRAQAEFHGADGRRWATIKGVPVPVR